MNDTTPEMEKLHRELLMQRSGQERMRMASSMFDTARALALASFGNISEEEKRVQLFLRFYGDDVDPKMKARIVAELRKPRAVASS
jgi:hypothetical protein